MKRHLTLIGAIVMLLAMLGLIAYSSLTSVDDQGLTRLHHAARLGDEAGVHWLLLAGADPNARTRDGQTPLHLAATPDIVTMLCRRGAKVDALAHNGFTPLHIAALAGRASVVQRLLALNADLNARTPAKEYALHLAVESGDATTVSVLLADGANPAGKDQHGLTPLQLAQERRDDHLVRLLKRAVTRKEAPAQ